jgi:histidinol phosphatase-like PHP family hydrolase
MYDLHTHSILSDGELLPIELVRRTAVMGYRTIGITDHVDASNISRVITALSEVREHARLFGVDLLCGVEITHVPPSEIGSMARRAKDEGADIVVVHGETVAEPVAKGTNRAAVSCGEVDLLAHPGMITVEEALLAKENFVGIELTARSGHSLTNGHVYSIAKQAGCALFVSSDAHSPRDLMTAEVRRHVAAGAGMRADEVDRALSRDIRRWLGRQ